MADEKRTAYRTCPLCEATCGLELTIVGDRVEAIRGDREDVFSRGFICPKGAALGELHSDPDRLRAPLVRESGAWREAGWDQAFERVDAGLSAVLAAGNRDAVAVYLGNPNVHNLAGIFYNKPLVKALRTRNVYSASTVDQMPKHLSSALMFGHPLTIPIPDLDRTQYLLMLGANPLVSNGSLCTAPDFPGRLRAIRRRGGKVVVVDPRRSRTAKKADEHVFVRPGTDAYLLFGMVATLFDAGLIDLGRAAPHVSGLEQVEALARDFSPEVVAPVCGVSPNEIRRLAHELSEAPTAAVYGRMGTTTVPFGAVTSWLVDVLNTLTGNLDVPGGVLFPRPFHERYRPGASIGGRGYTVGRWRSRVRQLPEVMSELPAATLADEILTPGDGQVRALITVAGNPVLSNPDGARLEKALGALDFMVSVDPYLNETTRLADVILPPPSPLERSHCDPAFYGLAVRNVVNFSPAVFPKAADQPDEWEILARLALIAAGQGEAADPSFLDEMIVQQLVGQEVRSAQSPLGGRKPGDLIAELAPLRGPERILDWLLRSGPYGDQFGANPDGLSLQTLESQPHGVDLGPLEPRLGEVLRTASGKVELAPELLVADVERLRDGFGDHERDKLFLVGRRQLRSNNSWMHNLPSLMSGKPRCTLQVHPDDAARLGLQDGGDARVESEAGAIVAPVEATDDVMLGVVSLPHGWGHDLPEIRLAVAKEHAGVNSNRLASAAIVEPLSGNAVLNAIPVVVSAAKAEERAGES